MARAQVGPDTTRPGPTTSAFDPEAGRFLRRYIDPDVYDANKQNWDATQDTSGVLYVGNTDGVLVYDGHSWRTIPTPNRSSVLSVAADDEGRVFVGAGSEFGVLRRDAVGRRQYVSLVNHLPERHQSFGDVNRTAVTDEGVYFQTFQRLFRWNPETKTMRSWTPSGDQFHYADVVRNTLYVNVRGQGLMAVRGDSLRLVPGGEQFADRSVRFILPHADNGLLVGAYRGLFVRDGRSFRTFQTEVDPTIREAWLYAGERLRDGTIAIGTIGHGLLLLAPNGTVRRHLHPRDKPVTGLYEDPEGGLWALLDGGMLRYEVGAPFTEYDPSTGLKGTVVDIARHRGILYAATPQSTFRLRTDADTLASFERVSGIRREMSSTSTWALLSVGDDLLIGTVHGLARQGPEGEVQYLFETSQGQVYDLIRSPVDSARIYAATDRGVRPVRRTADGWTVEPPVPKIGGQTRHLAEADDGTLWAGTDHRGVYRVQGLYGADSVTVDHFGTDHGLPSGAVWPYRWAGQIAFGTTKGVMHLSTSSESRFAQLPSFEHPPTKSDRSNTYLTDDDRGQTWGYLTDWGPGRWENREQKWHWAPGPLSQLRGRQIRSVQPEDEGRTIWFGGWEGRLLRYVPDAGWRREPPSVRVHHVSTRSPDSLLTANGASGGSPALDDSHNSLHLTYGTPSLVAPDKIEYQYRLIGRSDTWSDWTGRTEQTYRTLAPGEYSFAVRARTAYGDTTRTAHYAFSVLPPWYRTWWAYGLYLLAALGVVAGAVQWRTWQLQRRQEQLEKTVERRTREIEAQKETLAEQAERLEELDEAKSRFFANVSHEFRTPLTLIRGPVQDLHQSLQKGPLDPDATAEKLSVIDRNVGRLLRLVDQLLGIARMEAGTYQLDARPTNLAAEVRRIARTFEPLAEREGISFSVEATEQEEPEPIYVDREALEHVVTNLLSNAIKFTPEGGRVTVRVRSTKDGAMFTVSDTGPGIPPEQREAIFDRFEQVDDTATREQEGAGIGLAFTSDLVDLHGGTIDLESTEGEGTDMTVRFLQGTNHLADEHIADQIPSASPTSDEIEPDTVSAGSMSRPDDGAPLSTNGETAQEYDGARPGKRVLVVDDNAEVREYVRSILEPDFSVLEAADGEEGVAMAREELPDVILADVMMPSVDGHEMTQRLKDDSETEAIPVIMVTARAGTEEEVEGLQVGADDYVTKPFDAEVLQQRVEGVVALQERLRDRLRDELQSEAAEQEKPADSSEPTEVEQEARRITREHLTEPEFDATALAEHMAMSRSTLYRTFNEETDTTPSALITQVRMERAVELLQGGEGTVTQVAYAVGYDSLSGFSRAFREHVGQSPSAVATND